ncbi:MAG: hypothetical protein ACM3IJ_02555 [Candidatus Levyibacteriota bacterium]
MNRQERREIREDRKRRREELDMARSHMSVSKTPDFFGYLHETFGVGVELSRGNFQEWPSISFMGPEQFVRAARNMFPAKFKIKRGISVEFTDAGFTVTVKTWRKIMERGRIVETTREIEEEATRPYEGHAVLDGVMGGLKKYNVLSPIGPQVNFEPIEQKAAGLLSA